MNYLDKIINWGLCLFVFLLPWQTRWIFKDTIAGGAVWEYGRYSLYGTEILLVLLILLGIILQFRSHCEPSLARRSNLIFTSIALFIAYAGLSIIWSTDKNLALYILLKLIEGMALFWLIIKSRQQFLLKLCLIASGLIQGLFAIYQFFTQSAFELKWLGLALIKSFDAGASVIEFLDQRWLRSYGAFPHPNILGGFLAIVLLVIVISLWQLNRKIKEQDEIAKMDLYLNIFYWFSAGVVFLGLLFSFSRSACLGFAIGFIYLIIYTFKHKLKIEKWLVLKLAIFFMALIGFVLLNFPYQLFTIRITAQTRLEQKSLIERQNASSEAKEIFKENPILGVGLGNYTKVLQAKEPDKPGWYYQPAHNWYLLVLTELGLIGFLLFIFLLVSLLRKVKGIAWALIIPLLIISFFDHYFWTLYFGVIMWWLVWGLAYNSKIPPDPVQGLK